MPEEIRNAEVVQAQNNPSIISSLAGAPTQSQGMKAPPPSQGTQALPQNYQEASKVAQDLSGKLYGSGFVSGGQAQAGAASQQLFKLDQQLEQAYQGQTPYPQKSWYVPNPADQVSGLANYASGLGDVAQTSIGAVNTAERQYQSAIQGVMSQLMSYLTLQEQRRNREEDRKWKEKQAVEDKRRWESEFSLKKLTTSRGTVADRETQTLSDLDSDIRNMITLTDLQIKYGGKIDAGSILQRYNAFHSRPGDEWGLAKETPEELYQKFGITKPKESEVDIKKQETKQETLWLVDEVLGRDLGPVTGILRIGGMIPGTEAYTTKQKINQVISKLSVEAREKMKGSGQISDYESKLLQDSVATLNLGQSEKAIRAELAKIKDVLEGKYKGPKGQDDSNWVDTGRMEEK